MKRLRKAIFPVAGLGSRFLPATKSIPKEMLTVVDRPLIQYAVDEAIEAGIDILIFVISRTKNAISDYFDRNPTLEAELELKGKTAALEIIKNIIPSHVKCFFVFQSQPLGLGHAVLCAADLIGDEPFAVLLADDLIDGTPIGALAQMAEIYEDTGASVLAVEEVPRSEIHNYGVIKPFDPNIYPLEVTQIVEKPNAEDAPSNWSVIGRYILKPCVMEALKTQKAGVGGEIQLTDAIAKCLLDTKFLAHSFNGKRFDCGNKRGFFEANVHYWSKEKI